MRGADYRLTPITPEEFQRELLRGAPWDARCHAARSCTAPARYWLSYLHRRVGGQVTRERKAACIAHAAELAWKHGLGRLPEPLIPPAEDRP